jgi:hypothetical protein
MFSEQFQNLLKGASITACWILLGVLVALFISEFQGQFEVRLNSEEGYVKMIGPSSQCPEPK